MNTIEKRYYVIEGKDISEFDTKKDVMVHIEDLLQENSSMSMQDIKIIEGVELIPDISVIDLVYNI